jgi:phthalate 4,5-cis-dihydrodiol dehydrogenase
VETDAMTPILRLGIAGAGNAGSAILSGAGKVAGVEIVAAADRRKEALEIFRQKLPGILPFDSIEAMCAGSTVDAVWVATPNEYHAEHAIVAAEAGKHILCEKPMALTLEECDRMIAAAERNRVKFLLHSKASEPPIAKMREVIDSGRLGRVIQINSWNYKGWLTHARLPEEVDTVRGGGVVFRQAPHQIDIVRRLGDSRVKSVRAIAGRWNGNFDTEGNFSALFEFDDGTPATLVFNGYGFFDMTELTWDIGEGGGKVKNRYQAKERPAGAVDAAQRYAMPLRSETRESEGKRKQPFFGLTVVSCEHGDIRQSPDGLYIYTTNGREEIACPSFLDWGMELKKLYQAVIENQPVFSDARWGKATLEIVLAILKSSREGRAITLEHQVSCS